MGLDMFLFRTAHPEAQQLVHRYNTACRAEPFAGPVSEEAAQEADHIWEALALEEIGYWSKANAIHGWFVTFVQDGEDDQRLAPVSLDDLRALRDTITTVLADPDQAPVLLPTQDGFFFGSTDYNDGYFADLRETVTLLDRVLTQADRDRFTYLYHAWW